MMLEKGTSGDKFIENGNEDDTEGNVGNVSMEDEEEDDE